MFFFFSLIFQICSFQALTNKPTHFPILRSLYISFSCYFFSTQKVKNHTYCSQLCPWKGCPSQLTWGPSPRRTILQQQSIFSFFQHIVLTQYEPGPKFFLFLQLALGILLISQQDVRYELRFRHWCSRNKWWRSQKFCSCSFCVSSDFSWSWFCAISTVWWAAAALVWLYNLVDLKIPIRNGLQHIHSHLVRDLISTRA